MKNYSFKPTDENALELLRTNSIGRLQYVLRFITLLSHMEDDCYSIALNGDWGSGKTFFIKQVKLILDTYNPISQLPEDIREEVKRLEEKGFSYPANYTTVYYDAWANDSHVDPILSLIHATISSNQIDYTVARQRDIGNAAAAIADAVTERGISNALKSLRGTDQLASIKEKESIKELVTDFLDALINEHGVADGLFCREIDGLFCRSSPDIIVRRRCVLSHKRRGWLQPSPSFRYSRNLALQDELYHPVINNGPAVLVCVDKRLGTGPVNQSRDAG